MKGMKYQIIYADPPWEMGKMGLGKDMRPGRKYNIGRNVNLSYPTMPESELKILPVGELAGDGCHLWLWATNKTLHQAFHVMDAWGFKYLNTLTWVKPSGVGCWFVNRTQFLLFGYKGKCVFNKARYLPNVFEATTPHIHSQKPEITFEIIESISDEPRLELFARRKRLGWDCWGNEVESDIQL